MGLFLLTLNMFSLSSSSMKIFLLPSNLLSIFISAVQWYQITVCVALASVLSKLFFAQSSVIVVAMFWLSVVVGRPIGAYLFGKYADHYDRMHAVRLSFLLMFVATFSIMLLPTRFSILFVLFTFLQGFAIGGNHNISVMNSGAKGGNKYYLSSLSLIGFFCGFMASSAVVAIFNLIMQHDLQSGLQGGLANFAWRIPIFLSIPMVAIGLINLNQYKPSQLGKSTLVRIRFNTRIVQSFILVMIHMIFIYTVFVFLPNYKIMVVGESAYVVWLYNLLTLTITALLVPKFADIAYKYGSLRSLKLANGLLIATCALNALVAWDLNTITISIFFAVIMGIVHASFFGYITMIFHPSVRGRISSLLVNISASIAALCVPLMMKIAAASLGLFVSIIAFFAMCSIVIMRHMKEEWAK